MKSFFLFLALVATGCKSNLNEKSQSDPVDISKSTEAISIDAKRFADPKPSDSVTYNQLDATANVAISALASDMAMTDSTMEITTSENAALQVSGTYHSQSLSLTETTYHNSGVYQGPFGVYKRRTTYTRSDGSGYATGTAVGPNGNRGATGAVGRTPAGHEWAIGVAASPFGVCAGGAARSNDRTSQTARGCCANWSGQVKCSGF